MSRAQGFTLLDLLVAVAVVALMFGVGGSLQLPNRRASNERCAYSNLRTLAIAQADFRSNDRDGNRVNDYWTRDVSGLYTVHPAGTGPTFAIKLIDLSIAAADAENLSSIPVGPKHVGTTVITTYASSQPLSEYWFWSLWDDRGATPAALYRQDTDGTGLAVHNTSIFGLMAFPDSMDAGRQIFVVNEGNSLLKRGTVSDCRLRPGNPPGLPLPSAIFGGGDCPPWSWPSDLNIQYYFGRC